jgi:site-specific DNA recombinase
MPAIYGGDTETQYSALNTGVVTLLEGVMAAAAAARRIEISEEVKRGIKRKVEVGGTNGLAPIGYLNVREPLPHGGEVRTIAVDQERAPIIRWAFETYATGLYSLSDIVVLLEARGLATRPTRRHGPRPLTLCRVHRLLTNPYYAGYVRHQGHLYQGRHEPLVSQELYDKVQAVLVAHRHSGERDRKHQHYLKGTIRCGTCASQLVYSRNKGNGGIYEYFVCPKHQRRQCPQGYQPADTVEAAIEAHYATVQLSSAEREQIRQAITRDLGEKATTAQAEIERCQAVLEEIKEQERKLLHMHYQERISGELFDEEQTRNRRTDAEQLIARLSVRHEDITTTLDLALEIIGEDLQTLYQRAENSIRRLINQAIFNALYICDEEITDAELAEPFTALRSLQQTIHALPGSGTNQPERSRQRQRFPAKTESPDPHRGRDQFRAGSISEHLVRAARLELARALAHRLLRPACLPIPPRPRVVRVP